MSDWPTELLEWGAFGILSTAGEGSQTLDAIEAQGTAYNVGAVWPSANLALCVPMVIPRRITVYQLGWWNGTVASGNVDAALLDRNGNRLVSTGSTAQGTVSVAQFVDVTDTVLTPGIHYLTLALDNTTGTIAHSGLNALQMRACGMAQMASAFPIPTTVTFAAMTQAYGCPFICGAIAGATI